MSCSVNFPGEISSQKFPIINNLKNKTVYVFKDESQLFEFISENTWILKTARKFGEKVEAVSPYSDRYFPTLTIYKNIWYKILDWIF